MNCSESTSFFATPRFQLLGFHTLTVIGTPLHIFGAFCIVTKTPQKMSSLRWVLLQLHLLTFLLDVALNLLTAPFLPWPCIMGYPMGLMAKYGVPTDVLSYLTISLVAVLGAGITVLFEYRYHTLLNHRFWRIARFPFHVFNFTIALTFLAPQYLYFVPTNQRAVLENCGYFPCHQEIPQSAFALSGPVIYISTTIISLASYLFSVCFFFAFRLHWHVAKHQSMSEGTKRMQKKLQVALVLQCAIPVAAMGVPIGLMSVLIVGGVHSQAISNITMLMLASHGSLATIVMILVHEPYKKLVTDFIFYQISPILRHSEHRVFSFSRSAPDVSVSAHN